MAATFDTLSDELPHADLLVNATSAGMSPRSAEMPPVPVEALREHLFVYDTVYTPLETRLLREARRRGARGAHGAGMLARQGAMALEIWTGRQAPFELMQRVLLRRLTERAKEEAPAGAGN